MKKVLFVFALAFGLSAMSCDQCKTCTRSGSPELRICKSDYNNDQVQYDTAIAAAGLSGYTCN